MVNKQDFENYTAELQITIGSKITKAINKLNEAITVNLENNKDEIIQSSNNEVSSIQNRVDKLESQVYLLEDALINNEIKINNTDQYSRRNNIVIQGITQSIKYTDLEDKVINVLDKVNVKVTKNDIEACHRLGDSRKTIVRFVNRKHSLEALKHKKMLISVDLTSIGLDKNKNLFCIKTSDYNNKIAFHYPGFRRKRLIDSMWAYSRKVFIKIQDNGNKEKIKHLSQLTRKFPDHIFNFDDLYSPLFTMLFLL